MIHVAKQFDLPESPLGVDLVVERIRDLLYRHVLVRLRVQRGATQKEPIQNSPNQKKEEGYIYIYKFSAKFTKERQRERERPNDAICAFADGHDGGLVLGGDLEDVPEDVVLNELPPVT